MHGFETNGTTKNEIFGETPDSLSYPSIMKKFILHGQILCNINLNCSESVEQNISGVQHEASSVINIFGTEAPPSVLSIPILWTAFLLYSENVNVDI